MASYRHRRSLGRPYRYVWTAAAVSGIGDGMAFVAFPLLVATIDDDPRVVAGVAVAQRLPWLFAVLSGALVDRLDRRRLLLAVELGRAAILAGLAVAVLWGDSPLGVVYASAVLLGALDTAFLGAATAVLPAIVRAEQLAAANGRLFAVQMAGESFAGPAIGSVLFTAGASVPFAIDALTFAASGLLLWLAVPSRMRDAARPATRVRSDVAEGVRWFLASPPVRAIAALVACLAFAQAMVYAVLVLWAGEVLDLGPAGYGALLSVAAIGHLAGAVLAERICAKVGTHRALLGAAAAAAVAYPLAGASAAVGFAGAALILEMAAVSVGNVASETLRQTLIPEALLGRVGNAMRTCIFGAMPLGAAAGGIVADVGGLRAPFFTAGIVQGVAVVAFARPLLRGATAGEAVPRGSMVDA